MPEMGKMIEMEEMAEITARSYLSQYRLLESCMTAKLPRSRVNRKHKSN